MFEQVKLEYGFGDLEPTIDTTTMETHYGKHHAAYTAAFNKFVEEAGLTGKTAEEILGNLDSVSDTALRNSLRNQGGGYYNHNLYFAELSPNGGGAPSGELAAAIDKAFGSFDAFKEQISALALGQFGSGWAWLSTDAAGNLSISNSGNQDNPISLGTGLTPIFAIDVWEHAYYLKYKNVRADYVKAFFDVVDWNKVAENYKNR